MRSSWHIRIWPGSQGSSDLFTGSDEHQACIQHCTVYTAFVAGCRQRWCAVRSCPNKYNIAIWFTPQELSTLHTSEAWTSRNTVNESQSGRRLSNIDQNLHQLNTTAVFRSYSCDRRTQAPQKPSPSPKQEQHNAKKPNLRPSNPSPRRRPHANQARSHTLWRLLPSTLYPAQSK